MLWTVPGDDDGRGHVQLTDWHHRLAVGHIQHPAVYIVQCTFGHGMSFIHPLAKLRGFLTYNEMTIDLDIWHGGSSRPYLRRTGPSVSAGSCDDKVHCNISAMQ